VKLSVKSDYATRAVLGLARYYHSGQSVRVETLASEQSVPPKYLVQILIELKAHHIVRSQRGKEGGYLLARAPADISIRDVLHCIHGEVFDSPALTDPRCPPELKETWLILREGIERQMQAINFQQLVDRSEKEKMYYI